MFILKMARLDISREQGHPVNQGVLCAKGSAGIMQHYFFSFIYALKRVGERGEGKLSRLAGKGTDTATEWLAPIYKNNPEKLAFLLEEPVTGTTGWWAQQFGTSFAAHGGFFR